MSRASLAIQQVREFVTAETERLEQRDASLPFEREEYALRLDILRTHMERDGVDVLVLTSPEAMCWLTGYQSRWYRSGASSTMPPSQCLVVDGERGAPWMIESGFHELLVRLGSCVEDLRPVPASGLIHEPTVEEFTRWLVQNLKAARAPGAVVGVERWSWVPSPAVAAALSSALQGAGFRVVEADRTVRAARKLKRPAEIALIERAQHACDAGLRALQTTTRAGMTELEAWQVYMDAVVSAGGEPSAMHETVFSGPPEPLAHTLSSRRQLEHGEYFHADACACVDRYHARGTRTFSIGEPPAALSQLTEIAAGAFGVLRDVGRAGIAFGELNRALYDHFVDAGLEVDEFFAGGYELGISFPPDWVGEFTWSAHDLESEELIPDGLVTNFESCAFVALVDTVVFERDGARTLSDLPTEILIVEP